MKKKPDNKGPRYGSIWTDADKILLIDEWSGKEVFKREQLRLNKLLGRELSPDSWDDRIAKTLGAGKYAKIIAKGEGNPAAIVKPAKETKPIDKPKKLVESGYVIQSTASLYYYIRDYRWTKRAMDATIFLSKDALPMAIQKRGSKILLLNTLEGYIKAGNPDLQAVVAKVKKTASGWQNCARFVPSDLKKKPAQGQQYVIRKRNSSPLEYYRYHPESATVSWTESFAAATIYTLKDFPPAVVMGVRQLAVFDKPAHYMAAGRVLAELITWEGAQQRSRVVVDAPPIAKSRKITIRLEMDVEMEVFAREAHLPSHSHLKRFTDSAKTLISLGFDSRRQVQVKHCQSSTAETVESVTTYKS